MQWLKVILIALMVVVVPIKTTASVGGIYKESIVTFESAKIKEGKLRYKESKVIIAKAFPLIEKLNEMMIDLERTVLDKNREDKDFYAMLVSTQEIRAMMYLLDHCITISVNLIHVKAENYQVFLEFGFKRVDKLMGLIGLGITTIKVNFNFINNKEFIEKNKKVLEIINKIQKVETNFFDRLTM